MEEKDEHSAWELSKENIQPLKQGRKAAMLYAALDDSSHTAINSQRQKFETELRTYQGEDPLEVWYNYAIWIEQNYPKGGKDGNLKKLINSAIENLHRSDDLIEKYRNDPRYLQLWIKYARMLAKPASVYEELHQRNLCTDLAQFYEEYCWELEQLKNFKKTDILYQEGISRGAQPLESLKNAHRNFQARVAKKVISGDHDADSDDGEAGRNVFTALKTQGPKHKAYVERSGNKIIGGPGKLASETVKNANAPVFQIYSDENAGTANSIRKNSSSGIQSVTVPSSNLKENSKNPSQWNKRKMPQKTTSVAVDRKPDFNFYEDDNSDLKQASISKPAPNTNILTLRKNDPLDVEYETGLMFIPEPFDPFVKVMYPKDKVYCGTEEFSLEEIRAGIYAEKENQKAAFAKEVKDAIADELSSLKEIIKQQESKINQLTSQPVPVVNKPKDEAKNRSRTTVPLKSGLKISNKTDSKNIYEDSWLAINQTANVSVNCSDIYNESTAQAVVQERPLNVYSENLSSKQLTNSSQFSTFKSSTLSPIGNVLDEKSFATGNIGPPSPGCMKNSINIGPPSPGFSNNSIDLGPPSPGYPSKECISSGPPSPTIDTKRAMNAVNDLWSITLQKTDDQDSSQNCLPSPAESFNIYQDKKTGNSEPSFQIFSDEPPAKPQADTAPPFTIFSDNIQAPSITTPPVPDNNENIPPSGYIQKHDKRTISGILQPSVDIPSIPMDKDEFQEENNKHTESAKPFNSIEGVSPFSDYQEDFTIRLPRSNETFFRQATVASTPGPWSCDSVPQVEPEGDDYTMAFAKVLGTKEAIHNEEAELMPPPHLNSLTINTVPASPYTTAAPESVEKTYGHLSPILEMSRENRTSSSSSSSSTLGSQGVTIGNHTTVHTMSKSRHTTTMHTNEVSSMDYLGGVTTEVDVSKSGYLADKSKAESLGDTKSFAETNKRSSLFPSLSVIKENSFNPAKVAAELLMETEDDNFFIPSSSVHPNTNNYVQESRVEGLLHPIDPFSEEVRMCILTSLRTPVESIAGYHKFNSKLPLINSNSKFSIGKEHYHVKRLRGEGNYAQVFQATTHDAMNVTVLPNSEDDEENEANQMILKVEKPCSKWEFYICSTLRERLKLEGHGENILNSFMRINRGYFYNNGSILVSQYHKYGTLLNVHNCYVKAGKAMPELLVMYFAIELLKLLELLHSCDIIHGDIKPDNIIIKSLPTDGRQYIASELLLEENIPSSLKLIDFGRSIDMRKLPVGSSFTKKVKTDKFTCCEMRDGRPWTYQTDIFGLAGTVHCLLWSNYMNVAKVNGQWELSGSIFKRYWATDVWKTFFKTCLNIQSCLDLPMLSKLRHSLIECLSGNKGGLKEMFTSCDTLIKQYS